MKCSQASEITAYLQGEGTEEERAMLRRHFEQCESCARELAQFERAFGALGKVETIEPSADFQKRVEQAFLKAHPNFAAPKPKFRLMRAVSIAAGILIAVVGLLVFLDKIAVKSDTDPAYVSPEVFPTMILSTGRCRRRCCLEGRRERVGRGARVRSAPDRGGEVRGGERRGPEVAGVQAGARRQLEGRRRGRDG